MTYFISIATGDWCSSDQCNSGLLHFRNMPTIQVGAESDSHSIPVSLQFYTFSPIPIPPCSETTDPDRFKMVLELLTGECVCYHGNTKENGRLDPYVYRN